MAIRTRRNLATNPGPRSSGLIGWMNQTHASETSTTAWVGTAGAGPEGRTGFFRRTTTVAKTGGSTGPYYREPPGATSGGPGDVLAISAWVRASRALVVQTQLRIRTGGTNATLVQLDPVALVANTWTRIGGTVTTDVDWDGYQFFTYTDATTSTPAGTSIDLADVLVERADVVQGYFDGSMSVPGSGVTWEGGANASFSLMTTLEPDGLIKNPASIPPVRIEIFDKAFRSVGTVGDPRYVTVIPRYNDVGQMQFAVRSDHHRIGQLLERGAQVRVLDDADAHIMSGWVKSRTQYGPEMSSYLDFNVVDHFAALRTILGWVVPGNAITAQGTAGTNWTMVGPAETVLKEALKANGVNRLGLPIFVPGSLGRGATVQGKLRMQGLFERLFPVVDGAGISKAGVGFDMRLLPGRGLTLDTYVPRVRPAPLTEASGAIRSWSHSYEEASVTRAIIGGQGEGTLRLWREFSVPATETAIGWKHEVFRDARDTNDPTTMYDRGRETVTEGAAKAGFSVEFGQTPQFYYGGAGVRVGDQITIEVGGQRLTDILTEATLSWTNDTGWETRPRVGERDLKADSKLIAFVSKIGRALQNRNAAT